MALPRINFRIPPEMLAEAEKRAAKAGMSVHEWARSLVEKETGVATPVKMGIAGADERTRRLVERARIKGIKERAKEQRDDK